MVTSNFVGRFYAVKSEALSNHVKHHASIKYLSLLQLLLWIISHKRILSYSRDEKRVCIFI